MGVAEYVPFIQLGFAAIMAFILVAMVRDSNKKTQEQHALMVERVMVSQDKIAASMENHLSAISVAMTRMVAMQNLMQEKLIDAIILPSKGAQVIATVTTAPAPEEKKDE